MDKADIKIIILAAGKGTRMKSDKPKALTILSSKTFLNHILDTVASLGLPEKPAIVVGYGKEKVKETIGENQEYIEQNEQLGTGHAVKVTREKLASKYKTILVLYVDQPLVSRNTIASVLNKHREKHPSITLATIKVPDFEG